MTAIKNASTPEDLEELRTVIYPSLPSYCDSVDGDEGSIASYHILEMCRRLFWVRTPAQLRTYISFWDANYKGRVTFSVMKGLMATAHERGLCFGESVVASDKNRDGLIQ